MNWTVERVETLERKAYTGAPLLKRVSWHLIDPQGVRRDIFNKQGDAINSAKRLNAREG